LEKVWTVFYTAFIILIGAGIVILAYRRSLFGDRKITLKSLPAATKHLLSKRLYSPVKALVILLILRLLSAHIRFTFPEKFYNFVSLVFTLLFIAAFAWLVIAIVRVMEDAFYSRFDLSAQDNLRARKIYTQITVFGRLVSIAIGVLAFSLVLMNFEEFRRIGTGLLASVGIAGIIVGLAAQRTVGTLLAGIQLAISQPVRLDDVLVVEGEWGRVEEITFTYVVVRIWDSRRLILPTTYFLEKPFQNWTRVSADILGTVFLYLDYGVPLEDLRQKLRELLESSPYWDRRAWALQVTNCTDKVMEVRALMSAKDSGSAWELRCEIREKLLEYLRKNYPGSLPRVRLEKEPEETGSATNA
jgi:small-conductance mechanosensitive channel